ncbi:hypothetical protein V9T40_004523 [Parthenolecanium corni]|uniref:mRNA m(6)A methyltransferase n=1 Tax=Parthenolecanium corni TaxID=536013 RepID=A0AAN9YB34_9HEMI
MSDTWENIQAVKTKRNSIREKLQKRKNERQNLLNKSNSMQPGENGTTSDSGNTASKSECELEKLVLKEISSSITTLPITSKQILQNITKTPAYSNIQHSTVRGFLHKFVLLKLIETNESLKDGDSVVEINFIDHNKINATIISLSSDLKSESDSSIQEIIPENGVKRKSGVMENNSAVNISSFVKNEITFSKKLKETKNEPVNEIMSLISTPSIREKQVKKIGEEILDLLSKPTTKQRSLTERFRSQGGTQVMEFCSHRTRSECTLEGNENCKKLHFKKIIEPHTEESLGDCSYLNTCFHMDTCKYVHYEVDKLYSDEFKNSRIQNCDLNSKKKIMGQENTILHPPQWIQCDLRYFDTSILGKFAVVMADPPWDIHMELPYGTLSDDEMRQLGVPNLQDDGLLFLWVTGRAMELGRECMALWGYEYIDELVWVKTNQLQRIIRTGRTGHWLNHGKEHCLVGMKGNPKNLNRGLDCDVIVSEVRDTSHKPDEIYGIIERLSPGTRKIELFGRAHNVQPNWITLGNQVDGIRLVDPDIITMYKKRYPNGYSLANNKS